MSAFQIAKQTFSEWGEDKASTLAGALALYTMISLAPLLVIVTKVVGVVFRDNQEKVRGFMQQVLPGAGADAITEIMKRASQPGQGIWATVLSIAIAAYGATNVFAQLQDSLNTIWEVKPKPNLGIWGWIRARFLSMAVVLGIAFLIMVSTVGTAVVSAVGEWVVGENKTFATIMSHVISGVLMMGVFTLMFKYLPDANVRWKDALIGGVATGILFEIGKIVLSWYLAGASTQVFGAAASLAALLLWVYYSAQILFLGAEFTQVWAQAHGHQIEPSEHAVKITAEDRAQRGIPTQQQLAAATARQEGRPAPGKAAPARPARVSPDLAAATAAGAPNRYIDTRGDGHDGAKNYLFAAGGVVLGAVLGGLGVEYLLHDPKKPARRHTAAVRLNERLGHIEEKVGRVSRLKDYLEHMDVKERIDRVEKEVRRAGAHVRAKETGRPLWLVKLGDLIGGRWSNL